MIRTSLVAVLLLGATTAHAQSAGTTMAPSATTPDEPSRSMIEEDVEPTLKVGGTDDVEVRVGGLVQVFAAPRAGDDSLIENDDPVTGQGFRLRRARLGFEGRFRVPLRIQLTVDLLQNDDAAGSVSDAKISYELEPWLRLAIGTGKVPFSRGALESSRSLSTIERPLSVSEIGPDRRLGATAEGELLAGRLAYVVGVMNGTEGLADGNQYGGYLTGGRLQLVVLGRPDGLDVVDGIAVGASGFYERAPSTHGYAGSADLVAAFGPAKLILEGLCDSRTPNDAPDIAPTLADHIARCGAYATALYRLPTLPIEPVAHVELVDDNRDVEDAGDAWLLSAGINSQLIAPYLRAQLHYLRRVERHGVPLANNSIVLSLLGTF